MILWTWENNLRQWRLRAISDGEEWPLGEAALVWAVQEDLALLFARPPVAINGRTALPVQRLADRDEIVIGTLTWCVSFDSSPARDVFRAIDQPLQCARCHGPLSDGETTIACPRCRARYHDTDELPCWTYGPECVFCKRSTAHTLWRPAPLSRFRRRSSHDNASLT